MFEEYQEMIQKCIHCKNMCMFSCPTTVVLGNHAFTPSKKCLTVRFLQTGHMKLSDDVVDQMYHCCLCRLCEMNCLFHDEVRIDKMITSVRKEIVDRDFEPPKVRKFATFLRTQAQPADTKYSDRFRVIKDKYELPAQAKNLLLIGSYTLFHAFDLIEPTFAILKKAGVDFTILSGGEWPLGADIMAMGLESIVRENAERNIKAFEATGCQKIISIDPYIILCLLRDYPLFGQEFQGEVIHITQLLEPLIREGKLKLESMNARLSYIDNSVLGRYLQVYDSPRSILHAIQGIQLLEPWRNREQAPEIGSLMAIPYPEEAISIAQYALESARRTGAKVIITAAPQDRQLLRRACTDYRDILILDLVEIIARVLR